MEAGAAATPRGRRVFEEPKRARAFKRDIDINIDVDMDVDVEADVDTGLSQGVLWGLVSVVVMPFRDIIRVYL